MYCGKCGYLMKKTDMFCPYCGMSVQTTKKVSRSGNAAAMPKPRKNAYCGSCGYPIKNTDMFCPYCGMGA
ncbi:MAG: zinc-ribbon domain-containing protein [Ruminococcus sp.]|nr:zinc-ribbon domain-containing protein [Ruminococcus sp.]